jgi:hypothetical protein
VSKEAQGPDVQISPIQEEYFAILLKINADISSRVDAERRSTNARRRKDYLEALRRPEIKCDGKMSQVSQLSLSHEADTVCSISNVTKLKMNVKYHILKRQCHFRTLRLTNQLHIGVWAC